MKNQVTLKVLIVILIIISFSDNLLADWVNDGNVRINSAGSGKIYVNGNITNNGTSQITNNNYISLTGDLINNTAGVMNLGAGTFSFNGTASGQQISGPFTFGNLKIDNANGVQLDNISASPISVTGSLNLTNGILNTNTNILTLTEPAAEINASSGSYVIGNLEKYFTASPQSFNYPVGTANGYSPLSLNFSSITAGSLTCNVNQSKHPQAVANSLSRYWTLTASGGFSGTYAGTFNYLALDFETTFTEIMYEDIMDWGLYNSGWTYPTIQSRNKGGTSDGGNIVISGLSSFGDFTGLYDISCTPVSITTQPSGANKCEYQSISFTIAATGTATLSYQWKKDGNIINNATSTIYTISSLISGDAGTYTCVVSNCDGPLTSNGAVLVVNAGANIQYSPNDVSAKAGSNITFSVVTSGTPLTYTWQENTGSGWVNRGNGGANPTYSGQGTATLTISNIQASMDTYQYRCIVTDQCLFSVTSNPALLLITGIPIPGLWIGVTNTSWIETSNWDTGTLPDNTTDVIINSAATNQPVINGGNTGICKNITINPMASLTVEGILNASGTMTIKSTASGTGALKQIDGASVNTIGNVTVERYIATLGYHYFSSPFSTATVSQIAGFTPKGLGSGYYIPENPPSSAAMPNMWKIDEAHTHTITYDYNSWKTPEVGEVMDPLTMTGYALNFIGGNNSLSITKPSADLNKGNYTAIISREAVSTDANPPYNHSVLPIDEWGNSLGGNPKSVRGAGPTSGWHLVGNPYPSPVDWDAVAAPVTGGIGGTISHSIAYFKPTSQWGGVYGYYLPGVGGTGGFIPTQYIPGMQAFMISNLSIGTSPVLTFKNEYRSVEAAALNTAFAKKVKNTEYSVIRLSAFKLDEKNMKDETMIVFNAGLNPITPNRIDAQKLMNTADGIPNIYSLNNNSKYAIKGLSELSENLVIPLGLNVNTSGKYTINATMENIPAGTQVYLEDTKLIKVQNLTENNVYTFTINSQLSTLDEEGRFFLRFSNKEHLTTNNEFCDIYSSGTDLIVNYTNPLNESGILTVYDILGKMIISKNIIPGSYAYEMNIAKGVYIAKFIFGHRNICEKNYS